MPLEQRRGHYRFRGSLSSEYGAAGFRLWRGASCFPAGFPSKREGMTRLLEDVPTDRIVFMVNLTQVTEQEKWDVIFEGRPFLYEGETRPVEPLTYSPELLQKPSQAKKNDHLSRNERTEAQ